MDDVKEFMSKGYDERRAIRMALDKNRPVLEEMWDKESDMETDDDGEDEEDDDSEKPEEA